MAASDVQRDGANEARLRKERIASTRPQPESAQPGPDMSDQAAQQARQMRTERPSDGAAAQSAERRQGITQKAGMQIDRKRVEYAPETQVGDLSISRGRQVTEREEMGAGAQDRDVSAAARQQRLEGQLNRARRMSQGGGRLNMKDAANAAMGAASMAKAATMPARATPAGAAVGAGLDAAGGGAKAAMMAAKAMKSGGVSHKELKVMFGRGCVKSLWQSLWPSFGHTVYFLCILFFIAWGSKFARKYLPQVGEEWFPPELIAKIPPGVMIPMKLAEILALSFILFWVLLLDLACIGFWAFMLAIILTAAGAA